MHSFVAFFSWDYNLQVQFNFEVASNFCFRFPFCGKQTAWIHVTWWATGCVQQEICDLTHISSLVPFMISSSVYRFFFVFSFCFCFMMSLFQGGKLRPLWAVLFEKHLIKSTFFDSFVTCCENNGINCILQYCQLYKQQIS